MENKLDTSKTHAFNSVSVRLRKLNKGNILAQVDLGLGKFLRIKGFTVRSSDFKNKRLNDNVSVMPPSVQRGHGGWQEIVFFEDKELWFEIEKMIYQKYLELEKFGSGEKEEWSEEEISRLAEEIN